MAQFLSSSRGWTSSSIPASLSLFTASALILQMMSLSSMWRQHWQNLGSSAVQTWNGARDMSSICLESKKKPEFLGRLLVPRRVRGRDQGRLDLAPAVTSEPERQRVVEAGHGFVWLVSSPSDDFALGAEVVDSLQAAVPLDPVTCAVAGPRGWVICKKVKVVDAPKFVEDERQRALQNLDVKFLAADGLETTNKEAAR